MLFNLLLITVISYTSECVSYDTFIGWIDAAGYSVI